MEAIGPVALAAAQQRATLLDALRASDGDVRRAARALGWPERTAWNRLIAHGLREELAAIRAAAAARTPEPEAPDDDVPF